MSTKEVLQLTTPIPTGVTGHLVKLQSAQNRTFNAIPTSVKEHFGLVKKDDYDKYDYEVTVSFSGNNTDFNNFFKPTNQLNF